MLIQICRDLLKIQFPPNIVHAKCNIYSMSFWKVKETKWKSMDMTISF